MENEKRLGARRWISFILIGLAGQLAWAIENQYINLWVFSQSGDVRHITWMTIASAVMATLTTFLIGALSDRLGKRKLFISLGYTIWGLFVFFFGLISFQNMSALANGDGATAIILVGVLNTVVDCAMTFFGSTGNDACFNSMVTDQTNEKNRPFVESVLSILPLIAVVMMLLIGNACGVPGVRGETEGQVEYATRMAQPWLIFFLIFGILTTLVGIASFFLLPKDQVEPNRDKGYWKTLFYGFTPKAIKEHRHFYFALLVFLFFNIAINSFMPYYLVYFTDLVGDSYLLLMGIVLGISIVGTIAVGAFMERIGKMKILFAAIALLIAGALGLYFANNLALLATFATILMLGYLLGTAVLGATIRDETPAGEVGAFQGVRMIFAVMLPMIIGSEVSKLTFTETTINEFNQEALKADHNMFLVTLGAAALCLIPAIFFAVQAKKRKSEGEASIN